MRWSGYGVMPQVRRWYESPARVEWLGAPRRVLQKL
jgi:hypothetical protein